MIEIMSEYEAYLREHNMSENTLSSYLRDIETFFSYLKENRVKNPMNIKRITVDAYIEKLQIQSRNAFSLKIRPCMRMCGKGPNIKWGGVVYHQADEALLRKLVKQILK